MIKQFAAAMAVTLAMTPAAFAGDTPISEDARVWFYSPAPGSIIRAPEVHVIMRAENVSIVPAGTDLPNSGHHHILINTELENEDDPLPADFNHRHFGGGQTEAKLKLPPGEYTLQLVLADMNHVPHAEPVLSEPITIYVERARAVSTSGKRY